MKIAIVVLFYAVCISPAIADAWSDLAAFFAKNGAVTKRGCEPSPPEQTRASIT
jgi:hypothetical protein